MFYKKRRYNGFMSNVSSHKVQVTALQCQKIQMRTGSSNNTLFIQNSLTKFVYQASSLTAP